MVIDIDDINPINSSDDLNIYRNQKSFRIFAGPGAGKTHLLIENIKMIIQNCEKLKMDGRKILCITYTNSAADEIKKRLGSYNQYVYVSTIHKFIYENVLSLFNKQVNYVIKNDLNISLSQNLNFCSRVEGNSFLSTCKKQDLIDFLLLNNMPQATAEGLSKTSISKFIWNINDLNKYPFDESKQVTLNLNKKTEDEAKLIKRAILEVSNELDFDEILYIGYLLIKKYNHIQYSLRYKFPYVFVDEYQDTNPIQNATLKLFADDRNVVFGVIGDLAQSIYSFQGSTPLEFEKFSLNNEVLNYKIEDNRRSSDNIVNFSSYFRKSDQIIKRQNSVSGVSSDIKVKILLHSGTEEPIDVIDICKDTRILCRSAAEVFSFINIDKEQKDKLSKIANTYQYQKGLDLLNLIESDKEDWLVLCKFIVGIDEGIHNKSLSKILFQCKQVLDINKILIKSEEQGIYYKKLLKFLDNVKTLNEDDNLLFILEKINTWLEETTFLVRDKFFIPSVGEEYYNKNIHDNVKELKLSTIKKMIYDVYSHDSKIMTIHKAKGLEFEKVVLGIKPFSKEDVSPLDVFKNPILSSNTNDHSTVDEYTRIIYVGITRAIKELSIYIQIDSNEKETFKEYLLDKLREYSTQNTISEEFYEIIEI